MKVFNGVRTEWPGRATNHKLEFVFGGPPRPSSAFLTGRAGEGRRGPGRAKEGQGEPLTINYNLLLEALPGPHTSLALLALKHNKGFKCFNRRRVGGHGAPLTINENLWLEALLGPFRPSYALLTF